MRPISKIAADFYESEEDRLRRKQAVCGHPHWIKRCSHCGAILDSDHIHEEEPSEEIVLT